MASSINYDANLANACDLIRQAMREGAGLMILTGAGMSVQSGVPVFRNSDGSMSTEFLKFLGDYNTARRKHGLEEAPDWFYFSVPEMFRAETAKEAWQYWRWRILRARVLPAEDYQFLNRVIEAFGHDKVFAITSNCDMLHASAGLPDDRIYEIHGSLGYLQCSEPCNQALYPVDAAFLQRLEDDPKWVPECPTCKSHCLRPNVMIFGDYAFVENRISKQESNSDEFIQTHLSMVTPVSAPHMPAVVLEVGAGTVVSSIRRYGESLGLKGSGLIRINPSTAECTQMQLNHTSDELTSKYFPLNKISSEALKDICQELQLLS